MDWALDRLIAESPIGFTWLKYRLAKLFKSRTFEKYNRTVEEVMSTIISNKVMKIISRLFISCVCDGFFSLSL